MRGGTRGDFKPHPAQNGKRSPDTALAGEPAIWRKRPGNEPAPAGGGVSEKSIMDVLIGILPGSDGGRSDGETAEVLPAPGTIKSLHAPGRTPVLQFLTPTNRCTRDRERCASPYRRES